MSKPGPSDTDRDVGARLRLRRKAIGVTQSQLAEAIGLTFQQVQKYERGVNRVSAGVLVKIARRLDCPVTWLLGEDAGGPREPVAPAVLVTPGAIELLAVYAAIQSRVARASLLSVARALSEVAPDDGDADGDADDATPGRPTPPAQAVPDRLHA